MAYANDVLVETDWVAEHVDDESIRIVEVDENPALYAEGHIPGAIGSVMIFVPFAVVIWKKLWP